MTRALHPPDTAPSPPIPFRTLPNHRLDPKLDLVFKLLLTRQPALLRDMLEAVLGQPVLEVTILNPDIPGELASDKEIVLDIRVALADGSRVDLEMQLRTPTSLPPRIVYYGARDYADQLNRGDGYHLLTPTIMIVWVLEPLFPNLQHLHSIFQLCDIRTHLSFGPWLTIHLLQLSALSKHRATGYDVRVERWARFFVARDDAELDQLASEDPIMALAKQTLDQLSQDPALHRLARERSDAIKLYQADLATSRAEGEAKGEARILLKQLGLRFGPLPDAARARVEAATLEQLDDWAEQVLTAETLDEILAPR